MATVRLVAITMLVLLTESCGGGNGSDSSQAQTDTRQEKASLVVDPRGSPSSDCRPATPCSTIARAAQVAVAGDVVLIKPGTYTGDVVVTGAGTADRPIVFTAETPGTVVVIGHIYPAGWRGDDVGGQTANPYVTWQGLTVRNARDGSGNPGDDCQGGDHYAFRASLGWRIENSLIEGGQSGVRISASAVVLDGVTLQDLARYAFIGGGGTGITIRNSIIRRINTGRVMNPVCGAVTKFLFTDGVVFENNQSYDNVGPGFWLDWDNKNYVIRNNTLRNNRGRNDRFEGAGLWLEGNPASNGQVYGNTFADNTGVGIGLLETVGVEIYQNTFVGNHTGILLRNVFRGAERVLRDIYVHDNTFNSWTRAAVLTSDGDWDGWSADTHNVRFENNAFLADDSRPVFEWFGEGYASADEVPGLGAAQ